MASNLDESQIISHIGIRGDCKNGHFVDSGLHVTEMLLAKQA